MKLAELLSNNSFERNNDILGVKHTVTPPTYLGVQDPQPEDLRPWPWQQQQQQAGVEKK